MKTDIDTKEQVGLDELEKVDQLIYESQNEFFIEVGSDYFVDSKNMKSDWFKINNIQRLIVLNSTMKRWKIILKNGDGGKFENV